MIVEQDSSVYTFSTFFYEKLSKAGYSGVRKWIKGVNIFSMRLLLLPIHLGTHWCLCTADFSKQQFGYYDSMHNKETCCVVFEIFKQFLDQLQVSTNMDVAPKYNFSKWLTLSHEDIPRQHNNSDCGVFMCMYARHLSENNKFWFTQNDMPVIRRHMVLEFLFNKLL